MTAQAELMELKRSFQTTTEGLRAVQDMLKGMGRPAQNAEGLMALEARKNSRFVSGPDGMTIVGQRWNKGVGMGKQLAGLYNSAVEGYGTASALKRMKDLGWGQIQTKAANQETSGVQGGYTVPPEFSNRLLQLVFEDSVAMPNAAVMPMESRTLLLPSLDVTTRYATGQSPFLGGVVATWTEEAVTETETEPQFRQTELVARELSGYTVASNTLLQDNAVGLDALLSQLFTYAISWYSDYAFIQGDSIGKPQGILGAPATIFVTAGTAGHLNYPDVAAMYGSLLPQSHKNAVWVIHPTYIQDLLQLKDGASNNIFLPRPVSPTGGGGVQPAPVWELLGRPVYITEKLPASATTGAAKQGVLLVDWGLYIIGMRMEIEIAVSPHYKFINNQTVWRFVARLDGRPWLDNSVRLQDGSSTLSPFVGLKNA